jgi:hypothetical protein
MSYCSGHSPTLTTTTHTSLAWQKQRTHCSDGHKQFRASSYIYPFSQIRPVFPVKGWRKVSKSREGPAFWPLCKSAAWRQDKGPAPEGLFLGPSGEVLPAHGMVQLLLLPHLPCQACPDGHSCAPANYSNGRASGKAGSQSHARRQG